MKANNKVFQFILILLTVTCLMSYQAAADSSSVDIIIVYSEEEKTKQPIAGIYFSSNKPYVFHTNAGTEGQNFSKFWEELAKKESLMWKHDKVLTDPLSGDHQKILSGTMLKPGEDNFRFAVLDQIHKEPGFRTVHHKAKLLKIQKKGYTIGQIAFPVTSDPVVFSGLPQDGVSLESIWAEVSKLKQLPMDGERRDSNSAEHYTKIVSIDDYDYPYAVWSYLESRYGCMVDIIR